MFQRSLKDKSETRGISVSESIASENERGGEARGDCEPLSLQVISEQWYS